jgi:hypothetical protein
VFGNVLQPAFKSAFHMKNHQINVFLSVYQFFLYVYVRNIKKITFWCIFNLKIFLKSTMHRITKHALHIPNQNS